ncbi:hypothetical protein Tco_0390213 [Tanacetum coccineum]
MLSENKGWISFCKRTEGSPACYTKPIDSLKSWNNHFFWVDSFACPALFPWHTVKSVSKDPSPKPTDYNAKHYAVLVTHPAPFWKFLEVFLYLVGISRYYPLDEETYPSFRHDNDEVIDLSAFIHVVDPTQVRVVERERANGEPKLLDTTVRHAVALLPIALAQSESSLDASVEKLFGEGDTENVAAETEVVKKPTATARKDQRPRVLLLEQSILNAKVGVAAVPNLPFATSSVFATPKREIFEHMDSIAGPNLRTICPSERFVISLDSSHHSSTKAAEAEVESVIRYVDPLVMTEVGPHTFLDSSSADTKKPDAAGSSRFLGKELSMGSREVDSDSLHEVFVLRWCVPNDTLLDDHDISRETRLEIECNKQVGLLKSKDEEIGNLKAQLLAKEAEAIEATRLHAQVAAAETAEKMHADKVSALQQRNVALEMHRLETTCFDLRSQVSAYEHLKQQIEEFQDAQLCMVFDKMAKLEVDLIDMALHLEEKFYPHLLTIISGQIWLLTHGLKLFLTKCLDSSGYLTALGMAISRATKKGMQDGLAAAIDHEKNGRSLEDLVADNPFVEEDYNSALQRLRDVDFPLLTELKSHKDASLETIMDLLRLEIPLADLPRINDLQAAEDQLMVPIHRSADQVVLGTTSLSFALSVSRGSVEQIRKNIAEHRSALAGVYVPLVEPLSIQNLIGVTGTSDSLPSAVVTTAALSTTFASASSIPPVSVDDYVIADADNKEDTQLDVQRKNQDKGEGSVAS